MNYLLDTDICIYILNQPTPRLRENFQKANGRIFVGTPTEAELYYGALHSGRPVKNRERVQALLGPFERLAFDSDAAVVFAEIKEALVTQGQPIGAFDLLIASIAVSKALTLVSNNTREFERIRGLKLENWL